MKPYLAAGIYLCLFGLSAYFYFQAQQSADPAAHDRLLPVEIKAVKAGTDESELQEMVLDAKKDGDVLSIAGMQHSQGGHTLYPGGILLDMKPYNKILDFDQQKKTITAQSGATWDDLQEYINPYGLALGVSQSQNIFTIGGSLSVQAHGLDIRNNGMIDTVESLRLLNAEGEILQLSHTENTELFHAVVGGYGLFGIILDVTFELVDDALYEMESDRFDYDEYSAYFTDRVLEDGAVKMHLARISIAPDSFLEEMYAINYRTAKDQSVMAEYQELKEDRLVAAPKMILGLARLSDGGKETFWKTQKAYAESVEGKLITRNNAMRSDSEFMEYDSSTKTEILQEYFVPVAGFSAYIEDLKAMLEQEKDFNLLNVTIRYVGKNDRAVLSYAREDMFALVLLINQTADAEGMAHTERVVREMVEITLNHGGTYYLPYYGYPTKAQMAQSYPRTEEFFRLKDRFDPDHRFMNMFYEEYRQ